jgi:protein O-GlcNAc transferase
MDQNPLKRAMELHQAGGHVEAETICRQILARDPRDADAVYLLGLIAWKTRRLSEALEHLTQATKLRRDHAAAHDSLGSVMADLGQLGSAITVFQRAIQIDPRFTNAYVNLGRALAMTDQIEAAISVLTRAIELEPNHVGAHNKMGFAQLSAGRIDDAVASFRRALALAPDRAAMHSNLLLTMMYLPALEAPTLLAEHRAWADRHASPLARHIAPHKNDRNPDRPLRIAYLSGDFRRHSVAHFLLPILQNHKHEEFSIFCYSYVASPDEITERMKACCDGWRVIAGMADQAVADLIRADQIDVLVDLSGHSARNRLLVMARKPAPVQVTYLGYPNTTGLAAIDYRLTDAIADPPGMTDAINVEKLWRLPGCAWCYQPLEEMPEIAPRESGPITFGSFNALPKINADLLDLWAELLSAVPDSRLLLKSAGAAATSSQQYLREYLTRREIAADRVEMLGRIRESRKHLEVYHRVDVALDTFPYNGTTTTCDALHMGVPVVTLAGQTHVSRVGASLLTSVGLTELIAVDRQQYIQIAAALAADSDRLAEYRRTLRARMNASPLMDGKRFAREIESAHRQMWRAWCSQSA